MLVIGDFIINKQNEKNLKFQNYLIGNSNVPFIIAEAGVNHNGSIKLGKK